MRDLQDQVNSVAKELTDGFDAWAENWAEETDTDLDDISIFDYLQDVLDIEYRVGSEGEYRGSELLVCFGGPNIWIDTKHNVVRGAWWGESAVAHFEDNMGIDEAVEELWNCR